MYLKVMDILRYKRIVKKEEKLMELYEVKNTRISSGGGYKKVPLQKIFKIGGQCSPSINEGWCQAR